MSFESSEIRLSSTAVRGRLRWLLAGFVILLLTVFGRLVALEMRDGRDYRVMAAEPVVRKHTVPAMRGRILARDGTALAYDQPLVNLALNYRWLEEPADSRWLYRMARARLSAAERRDSRRIAQEEEQILAERHDLHERLASLCGMSEAEWHERAEQIQKRVEALAGTVNTRHENAREAQRRKADDTSADSPIGWLEVVSRSIGEALSAWDDDAAASWLSVAEEQSEHVICADLPLEAVAEIETHPAEYPGVTLTHSYRRAYPQGELAAHAVGYLGLINAEELAATQSAAGADAESNQPDDLIGRAGVEWQYEKTLRGHRGLTIEQVDAQGHTISSTVVRQPKAGSDVVLTIDPALQRTAQALLDQALARRLPGGDGEIDKSAGGAVVAIDIQSGAILAAASGPRFNCDGFAQGDREAITNWLNDPARPLFDRTMQMALPPGSVFKTVSAVAMLSVGVNPDAAFECQGYLKQPDALRCAIFRRYGIGHGAVTLSDALARSCNVYFFHYASQIGAAPLVDWARRLGMGQLTGVDLPGEAKGNVPATGDGSADGASLNPQEALMISIGQGPITATPLQVVRMMAAVANGGYLVSPHVVERLEPAGGTAADRKWKSSNTVQFPAPRPVAGLNGATLVAIRKGLRQTVSDEQGTAHAVIDLNQVAIAGKTGTAETGGNQPEHAWFVGYAPAERPQVAFVVVLEHAGNAPPATGPVIQYLVKRMDELGYFNAHERWAAGGVKRNELVK